MAIVKTVLLIWGLISIIPFLCLLAMFILAKKPMPRFEDDSEANNPESAFNEVEAEKLCPWAKSPKLKKRQRQPIRPPAIHFAHKAKGSPAV